MPSLDLHGCRIYYELHGPEKAPLVVLNNGILMNAATSWVHQTRPLARHYRVLQYDCRGQGQSDHPPGPYSMQQHAADLVAMLDALNVETAHLAGISYGGEVAQAAVLDYPDRVASLFLADTVSEVGPALRIVVESWLAAARAADPDAFFAATVPWNFSANFIAARPDLVADARRRYRELDFAAIVNLCEAFLEVNFTAQLHRIGTSTCILVGELDQLKGRTYAELLHQEIPDSELHVLPQAGHASCWEQPAAFNTVLLGFLAKQA